MLYLQRVGMGLTYQSQTVANLPWNTCFESIFFLLSINKNFICSFKKLFLWKLTVSAGIYNITSITKQINTNNLSFKLCNIINSLLLCMFVGLAQLLTGKIETPKLTKQKTQNYQFNQQLSKFLLHSTKITCLSSKIRCQYWYRY